MVAVAVHVAYRRQGTAIERGDLDTRGRRGVGAAHEYADVSPAAVVSELDHPRLLVASRIAGECGLVVGTSGDSYVGICILICVLSGRALDAMSVGEDESRSLGVRVRQVRLIVIAASSLGTAAIVSAVGLIGFVGIIVPTSLSPRGHLVSKDSAISVLFGAAFLVFCDTIARTVMAPPSYHRVVTRSSRTGVRGDPQSSSGQCAMSWVDVEHVSVKVGAANLDLGHHARGRTGHVVHDHWTQWRRQDDLVRRSRDFGASRAGQFRSPASQSVRSTSESGRDWFPGAPAPQVPAGMTVPTTSHLVALPIRSSTSPVRGQASGQRGGSSDCRSRASRSETSRHCREANASAWFLARALAQSTMVIVLDEPTTGLDLRHQMDLLELLRRRSLSAA